MIKCRLNGLAVRLKPICYVQIAPIDLELSNGCRIFPIICFTPGFAMIRTKEAVIMGPHAASGRHSHLDKEQGFFTDHGKRTPSHSGKFYSIQRESSCRIHGQGWLSAEAETLKLFICPDGIAKRNTADCLTGNLDGTERRRMIESAKDSGHYPELKNRMSSGDLPHSAQAVISNSGLFTHTTVPDIIRCHRQNSQRNDPKKAVRPRSRQNPWRSHAPIPM